MAFERDCRARTGNQGEENYLRLARIDSKVWTQVFSGFAVKPFVKKYT